MNTEVKGIHKEISRGNLIISKISKSEYQKEGTLTAELQQVVTTRSYYPTKSIESSLQDNIFSTDDFGFKTEEKVFEEIRVAWIDVPEGMTKEQVQVKLDATKGACLYKILANRPILTDSQQYAVDNPEINVSLDDFSNKQAVRYPNNHENAGELALDANGKVQYRAVFFTKSAKEDIDRRNEDPSDFYISPEIRAEINQEAHIINGQSI